MKAIVYTKYGPPEVLQLKEVAKPSPKEGEALVKVHAASLNAAGLESLIGVFFVRIVGPLKPIYKILGSDIAGRVEPVGSNGQFSSLASASDGFAESRFIQRLRKGKRLVDSFQRNLWTVTGSPRR